MDNEPPWLWSFILSQVYHKYCREHTTTSPTGPRNFRTKLSYFDITSTRVLCRLCKHRKGHQLVIPVYRVASRTAVRVNDLSPYLDLTDITTRLYNDHYHIFMNKRPERERWSKFRIGMEDLVCLNCDQKLNHAHPGESKYCSIFCKYNHLLWGSNPNHRQNAEDAGEDEEHGNSEGVPSGDGEDPSDSEDAHAPDDDSIDIHNDDEVAGENAARDVPHMHGVIGSTDVPRDGTEAAEKNSPGPSDNDNEFKDPDSGYERSIPRDEGDPRRGHSGSRSHVSDSEDEDNTRGKYRDPFFSRDSGYLLRSPQESGEPAPPWLWPFIMSHVYHKFCKEHTIESSPKPFLTKLKFFEPVTQAVLCQLCTRSKGYPRVIQVYKVTGRSAVRATEISPFLDVKEISGMMYNNCLHLFIKKRSGTSLQKEMRGGERVCLNCEQSLIHDSGKDRYCSIFCKFDFKLHNQLQVQSPRDGYFDGSCRGTGDSQQIVPRSRSVSRDDADRRIGEKDLEEVAIEDGFGHAYGGEDKGKGSSHTADTELDGGRSKERSRDGDKWKDAPGIVLRDSKGVDGTYPVGSARKDLPVSGEIAHPDYGRHMRDSGRKVAAAYTSEERQRSKPPTPETERFDGYQTVDKPTVKMDSHHINDPFPSATALSPPPLNRTDGKVTRKADENAIYSFRKRGKKSLCPKKSPMF